MTPNPSIERTCLKPLRAFSPAAHVERSAAGGTHMRTLHLFFAVAAICTAGRVLAEPVTIYFYNNGGGSGFFVRRSWYVDGTKVGEIRSGEKVTVDLRPGKHTIRGNDTNGSYVLDVRGPTIIKYTTSGFVEALVDLDPELKREFSEMSAVTPLAFVPEALTR